MQQQRSQEDSYIHKRLIVLALYKDKKHYTIVIYVYKYVNMICINTGNSRSYLIITIQESRIRRFKLFEKCMFK